MKTILKDLKFSMRYSQDYDELVGLMKNNNPSEMKIRARLRRGAELYNVSNDFEYVHLNRMQVLKLTSYGFINTEWTSDPHSDTDAGITSIKIDKRLFLVMDYLYTIQQLKEL